MSTQRSSSTGNAWATGVAIFAAVLLLTAGLFQVVQGFVAILDDEFFVHTRKYTFEFDTTAWGWIHLIIGIVLVLTGFFLFTGAAWARIVGIAVAVLSLLANFLWLPYYPFWAIVVIALDVLVIWALSTYDPERV
jgi:hypothetical protein